MNRTEALQVGFMTLSVVALVGGAWTAGRYRPPPGAEDVGWASLSMVVITLLAVAVCGVAVAVLTLLKYRRRADPSFLERVEVGLAVWLFVALVLVPGVVVFDDPIGLLLAVLPLGAVLGLYAMVGIRVVWPAVQHRLHTRVGRDG